MRKTAQTGLIIRIISWGCASIGLFLTFTSPWQNKLIGGLLVGIGVIGTAIGEVLK